MTAAQIATNSLAVRALADRLEQLGYRGDDVVDVAERLAADLIAAGYRRIDRVPELRPANVATEAERRAALTTIRTDVAVVQRRITTKETA